MPSHTLAPYFRPLVSSVKTVSTLPMESNSSRLNMTRRCELCVSDSTAIAAMSMMVAIR